MTKKKLLEVADRIVVISKRKKEQVGTPEEVFHNPANEFVINFFRKCKLISWKREDGKIKY